MSRSDALLRLTSRLIDRRNALRKVVAEDVSRLRALSEIVGNGDQIDRAVDSANDEICSRLAEIESRELAEIEATLRRIAEGKYGRCESCNGRIPAARLNALPCTTRCIECRRSEEQQARPRVAPRDAAEWPTADDRADSGGEGEAVSRQRWLGRGYHASSDDRREAIGCGRSPGR